MPKKAFYAALAAALCLFVPAAVWALYQNDAKALYCKDNANPVCGLYRVCRPILDNYPESEITEKGKDCTLTIEARQIIIRRKRVDDIVGYYFYANRTTEAKKTP